MLHITYPKAGYIKILHLTGYAPIVAPPPPPVVVKVPFTLTQTVNIEGMKPYTFIHSGEVEKA